MEIDPRAGGLPGTDIGQLPATAAVRTAMRAYGPGGGYGPTSRESGTNWGEAAPARRWARAGPHQSGVNPVPPAMRHVHLPRFVPLSV